jgi:DNA-binding LacI/PurR family transcriptional regulator
MADNPPRSKPHAATIRQVAALAGVSTAAVSRYVNAKQRFTPDVEARIAGAIAQVGYRSNPLARSMATGRSGTVAALVAGVERPHTAALIKGISRAALLAGYDLLIVDMARDTAGPAGHADVRHDIDRVLGLQVDGLLIAAPTPPGTAEMLVRYGRPFVDLARGQGQDPAFEQAGALLGYYLARSGHRRVSYLACEAEAGSAAVEQGLRRAWALSGEGHDGGTAITALRLPEASAQAAAALAGSLLLKPRSEAPDAVVACNDTVAMGLLSEARRLAVRVPHDVSVAGVGNIMLSRYLTPALTSVELHSELRGENALADLLCAVCGHDAATRPATPPPRLVVRESTRAR